MESGPSTLLTTLIQRLWLAQYKLNFYHYNASTTLIGIKPRNTMWTSLKPEKNSNPQYLYSVLHKVRPIHCKSIFMYCRMQGVNTSPAFCDNEKVTKEEDQETVPEIIIKDTNKIGKTLQLTCYRTIVMYILVALLHILRSKSWVTFTS